TMPRAMRAMRPPTSAPLRTMPMGAGKNTCWNTTRATRGARKARRSRSPSTSQRLVRSMAADVIARVSGVGSGPGAGRAVENRVVGRRVPGRRVVDGIDPAGHPGADQGEHHVAHLGLG